MRGKISRSIFFALLSVLTLAFILITVLMYTHFTNEHFDQLRNETKLVAHAVAGSGAQYFDGLGETDFRITWITEDGRILYDNEADSGVMENHMERDEIRSALQTGYGESSRYSSTLLERQLYTAQKLPDGTVLRLSITQATIWNLLLRFLLPMTGILIGALLISTILASSLSKRIVEPLNTLDLDAPMSDGNRSAYIEIRPLLKRLDDQRRQLANDREELERTSQIRQEFTANASHELKTPLHVISGYAELLESGMVPTEESRRLFAGKIRTEAQRMSELVEDIIDLSRLDSGGIGMTWELTDLYRIALNAVESLASTAGHYGVTVSVLGASTSLFSVSHALYSIIYNLCSNAIHYSERGGHVIVRVTCLPDTAVLSVEDNGIGIPPEDLDRIFERFYRVDKSRSKEVGGTGLGLSIVKHTVRTLDAQISVTSELGKGSVFTVTFPRKLGGRPNGSRQVCADDSAGTLPDR